MPYAFLLALVAVASATLVTYLYERDAPLLARLCAGVATGFAALGLVGFVLTSVLGMTPAALALTCLAVGAPLLLLVRAEWRARVGADAAETARTLEAALAGPRRGATGTLLFYLCAALLLWFVFDRAMYQNSQGIFTGVDNNIGDLPFHISIITGFADGANFPPQHTEFAGARLTYPFIIDFVAALFVRAGASLKGALFWENFALALSLVGLLHRWAWVWTRERAAALLTPALVLLSGGMGWTELFDDASQTGRGLLELLWRPPHDYTIMSHLGYRWGNAITTLLVPQRGLLLGIPLSLVVLTLWWKSTDSATDDAREDDRAPRRKRTKRAHADSRAHSPDTRRPAPDALHPTPFRGMLAAGVVTGLLPLVHAHSFLVLLAMGGCLALLPAETGAEESPRAAGWRALWQGWRVWLVFFAAALVLGAPQMWWATRESAVRAGQFVGWEFGWDHGQREVLWFWLKNTGLFIPLLVAALAWRGRRAVVPPRLLRFYLPFTLCFIVSNLVKLSPWVWDNIKVIFYWWLASAPLVALLLVRLWRRGAWWRAAVVAAVVALTLAGSLDVWRVAAGASEQRVFDAGGLALAELIKRTTPPRSLILHAPTYNDPVYLSGRRTFIGYPGHLWSHGIDYAAREDELKRIYTGAPDAAALLARERIDYVVTGPLERDEVLKTGRQLNDSFFERFTKVGEAGGYRLYKTAQP